MRNAVEHTILFKIPTRARPKKLFEVIDATVKNLSRKDGAFSFLLTVDRDDLTMQNKEVLKKLNQYPNMQIVSGASKTKVEAINRDLKEYKKKWDILVLLSDDMVPVEFGFDQIIRDKFDEHFPDLDGVVWFNDGKMGNALNTCCILGKNYYNRFNYIYYPKYESLFCDQEFTEVANILKKQKYFHNVIIEHRHFLIKKYHNRFDELYQRNYHSFSKDKKLFGERLAVHFDLKVAKT